MCLHLLSLRCQSLAETSEFQGLRFFSGREAKAKPDSKRFCFIKKIIFLFMVFLWGFMLRCLILLLFFVTPWSVSALYFVTSVKRVYTTEYGITYVGFSAQPPGTCSYWGEYMKFDTTTDAGKNMLSVVIAAKVSKHSVNIWYAESSAPGSTNTDGCNTTTMATLTGVGLP